VESHAALITNHMLAYFVMPQMSLQSVLVRKLLETLLTLEHFLSFFQRLMSQSMQ
jgi:hypothetical protein